MFDSTGVELKFNQLSGGEREIAFLIGQLERFALRRGLLLIDEPELHLNNDLIRGWIGFLKGTVEVGQIWLATHSLEVVEVVGAESTFLIERDEESRTARKVSPLSARPLLSSLSRSVGSPAFSISNDSFIWVEGEEAIGERERYRNLCGGLPRVRFLEAGPCNEVVRRVTALTQIGKSSSENIRVGGIVDFDWRGDDDRRALQERGIFVLSVHEIENLFLHPETLRAVQSELGRDPTPVDRLVAEASDRRAGLWIFGAARAVPALRDLPPPCRAVRERVASLGWTDFSSSTGLAQEIADLDEGLDKNQKLALREEILRSKSKYAKMKSGNDLWRRCQGKEVLRQIYHPLGFADQDACEKTIIAYWLRNMDKRPAELLKIVKYVKNV
jgi:hypothetical protein